MFGLQPKGVLTVASVFFLTTAFLVVLYNIRLQQTYQVPAQTFDYQSCQTEGGEVLPEGSACDGEAIPIIINSSINPPESPSFSDNLAGTGPNEGPTPVPGQSRALCCLRREVVPTTEPTIIVPTPEATVTESPVLASPTPTLTVAPSLTPTPIKDDQIPSTIPQSDPTLTPTTAPQDTPRPTATPTSGGGGGDSQSCVLPAFTVTTEVIGCVLCSSL